MEETHLAAGTGDGRNPLNPPLSRGLVMEETHLSAGLEMEETHLSGGLAMEETP